MPNVLYISRTKLYVVPWHGANLTLIQNELDLKDKFGFILVYSWIITMQPYLRHKKTFVLFTHLKKSCESPVIVPDRNP